MLGAAKADLEPHVVDGRRKQCTQIGRCGLGEIEREPRQQRVEQGWLARLERMTFAAAEESALRWWAVVIHHVVMPGLDPGIHVIAAM